MRYKLKIQIGNNEPNFGKGVVELLELCDKYGSLSKAYKEMGMSNSKAWKIIKEEKGEVSEEAMEDLGYELVSTTSGGSHGGGSCLTLDGKELVRKYKLFQEKIEIYSKQVFKEVFEDE